MVNKLKLEKKERNKKDKAWKEAVHLEWNNRCAVCSSLKCLNAHHIISRDVKEFRWNTKNGILLCVRCHKFGTFSAHKGGIWFAEWLRRNHSQRYAAIIRMLEYKIGMDYTRSRL